MKTKRMIALLLCVTIALSLVLTGCGGGGSQDQLVDNSVEDTTNLNIMYYAMGYGTQWMEALVKAFQEKNPGVNVNLQIVRTAGQVENSLRNPNTNDVDLYFSKSEGYGTLASFAKMYNDGQAVRDLTELYNTTIPGEDQTIAEKLFPGLRKMCQVDGRDTEDTADDTYYWMPYVAGNHCLFYNEDVINNALGEGNWELPRTTDELIALCEQLKAEGCVFFVPGMIDYWSTSLYQIWWAQYEGFENYTKFYEGIGYNSSMNREEKNSNKIFNQPGRLASAQTCYELLNYNAGYVNQNAAEIGVDRLNDYQTNFMIQENKYAFYVSGDWLMQEVQNNTTVELDSTIKMMKVPVASNILEATNSYSAGNEKRLPNITSDEMLSQVVAYVDGEGELPAGVTEEEVEYIRSARNMVATLAPTHTVFAPAYSNAKTLADQFLLFMASDEGIQIFKDNCSGGFSPFQYEYDYEKLHETEKSIYDCTKDAVYVGYYRVGDIFSKANVQPYNLNTYFVDMMTAKNGQTPEEYNNVFLTEYSDDRWSTYLNRLFE